MSALVLFLITQVPLTKPLTKPAYPQRPPCDLHCQRLNHPWPGPGRDPWVPAKGRRHR